MRLPRSFNGPVTITTKYGTVRFSEGLSSRLTHFGESKYTQRYFLGDWASSQYKRGSSTLTWQGDELVIDAKHGAVKVAQVDDAPGTPLRQKQGYFSKMFGF